ncbi:MAG: glycosyltransferase family 2 protein [bacterium]
MTSTPINSSISIIVPAYNEGRNLADAVSAIEVAASHKFREYEILIIDDASTDNTGEIADELSMRNGNVKSIHNPTNMGMGFNYRLGVGLATKEYIGLVPGDNELMEESIMDIFDCVGMADMVLPYHSNSDVRSFFRRSLSGVFTAILNMLFGFRLKYFNGPAVQKRSIISKVPMTSNGFAYQAEILARLLKAGHSYIEVGMKIRNRQHGHSKALYPKNIFSVFRTVALVYWDVTIKGHR